MKVNPYILFCFFFSFLSFFFSFSEINPKIDFFNFFPFIDSRLIPLYNLSYLSDNFHYTFGLPQPSLCAALAVLA